MKKSLMLALAILALGAAPGFFQQDRLAKLREEHSKLAAEGMKLGLNIDAGGTAADARLTKRQREDRVKLARQVAVEVLAFAKESEAMEKRGDEGDEAFQNRAMDMMSRLMELDPAGLRQVIASLRESREISNETRGNIIAFAIMSLAGDHPEAAVSMFAEASDLMDDSMLGEHVIASALNRWAELDPAAALDWVRNNSTAHPEILGDTHTVVLAGVARNNPKLAFELAGGLAPDQAMNAINAIVITGHDDPVQRSAVLTALREHLTTVQDESERQEIRANALEMLARTADKEGFDSLTKWMESAAFTPQEKGEFAAGLTYFTTKNDTGKWVEWMAGNLPAESLRDPVRETVGEWTQQDYVSAGQWLSSAPEGPARTAAVEAYAEAVAEYEPQVAAQWAMTLPPGPGRDSTLKAVYQNWPASDPEGAAAFAREHGLE
jgi:hypothetical protein